MIPLQRFGREGRNMTFMEQEVHIEGRYTLSGTLTLPRNGTGKHPAIIMVHGSGEVDRDENAKRMKINAFKELSHLAVEEGFAVLRYDKRGIGKSKGDYYETGLHDLIEDAEEAVNFARKHPSVDEDQLIILGHSEGAMIAPAVYKKAEVQGMILLSGSAEPLGVTTEWQREALKKDMRQMKGFQGWLLRTLKVEQKFEKMNSRLIERIKATDEAVIRFKGKKINAKWNREHMDFNVAEYLPEVTCPVLAITGSKDVQVKPEQVETICELVHGPCKAHLIPDLTHLLRKTDKEHNIGKIVKDYKSQTKNPVDSELKNMIRSWLMDWKVER